MNATPIQYLPVDGTFPNRSAYDAAHPGAKLGPFDPSQNVRAWTLRGKTGPTTLFFLPADPMASELIPQTFDGASLSTPNLTGAPTFEAYEVPTLTPVTWGAPNSMQTGFPPNFLSKESDAQKVATAIGGTLVNGTDYYKPFGITFNNLAVADPLQPWMITGAGNPSFAGPMIEDMYKPGIDSPGEFVKAASGAWGWVPSPVDDGNDGKPHPTQAPPVVPFDTSEFKLSNDPTLTGQPVTILGAPVMVVPINAAPVPASNGSTGDSANISQILSIVQNIEKSPILGVGR